MSEQMDFHGWLGRISSCCLIGWIFYNDTWQPVTKHKTTASYTGLCYCDFSQLVKYTWGQSLWRLEKWPPCHSWWFLVLRKCPISVLKSPGSSWGTVFSFWIASCCWYVLVCRQGSKEWPATQWSGDGEFLPKEANAVVTAAPRCRESLDVFWQIFGKTVSVQPALLRWAGGGAKARDIAKISAFVTQICIATGFWAAVLFSTFPFFNKLPRPPPQEQYEQESLHTIPLFWYWVALAQTESTF